jgi:hypothetical protein
VEDDITVPLLSLTVSDDKYHTFYEKLTIGLEDTSSLGRDLPRLGSRCTWFVDQDTGAAVSEHFSSTIENDEES